MQLKTLGERIAPDIINKIILKEYFFSKNKLEVKYVILIIPIEKNNPKKYKTFKFEPNILNIKALNKYANGAYIEKIFLYKICPLATCSEI